MINVTFVKGKLVLLMKETCNLLPSLITDSDRSSLRLSRKVNVRAFENNKVNVSVINCNKLTPYIKLPVGAQSKHYPCSGGVS